MTILDFATTHFSTPATITRPGVTVIQLHDELWRVTRDSGEVIGYIERFIERGDHRYRAKRMLVLQKRFVSIGEFWRMDEALDVLAF